MNTAASLRTTFRIVKGAPLTVLFALLHLGGEAGLLEVCQLTSYTDKTADKALQTLMDAGLVTRTHFHKGFVLTRGGFQLPLELSKRFLAPRGDIGDSPMLQPAQAQTSEKFVSTTATDSLDQESLTNQSGIAEVVVARKNSDVLEALKRAGIGEPTRSQLAQDPHLTPEFVNGHDALRRQQGHATGMLVHRLRKHDDLPARFLKPPCTQCGQYGEHAEGCGQKYYGGAFSEIIEH